MEIIGKYVSELPDRKGTARVCTLGSSESESSATMGGADEARIGGAAEREVEATGKDAATGIEGRAGTDGLAEPAGIGAAERPNAS